MRNAILLLLTLAASSMAAFAQSQAVPADKARSIEGYWQDSARRILFAREAPPGSVYGTWTALDPGQTYPSSKHIRRSGAGFELVDLLYDDEYVITVVSARENAIEFVRAAKSPACAMHHDCRLDGEELACSLENTCVEGGRKVLDWRGEERYVRRAHCERDGRRQLLGIPNRCR